MELAHGGIRVAHIAQPKAHRDHVKGGVGEGQAHRVRGGEGQIGPAAVADPKHPQGEVRGRMGGNREIYGEAFGWLAAERYELTSQGEAAERVAEHWNLTREALDAFAVRSHQKAAAAAEAGYFTREIAPVPVNDLKDRDWAEPTVALFSADETIRPGTAAAKLATLKSSFRPEGRLTAGNSSQISDGAAVLLLMSEAAVTRLGVTPKARIRAFTTVGSDPTLMLTGPIAATRRVLAQAGLSLADIDLYEVNEAFAPVPLMWQQELGADLEKLNVNGGAIALGHPLGASGARIMTSLLYELARRGGRYGLQAICCAGGMGTATIIERL